MNKTDTFFYGWIIVLASFLLSIASGIEYVYGIFFKPMAYDFGWSRTATSLAYSIYIVICSASGVLMGKMTDKYGPKFTVECGAVMCGLGMVLSYWIGSLWHLYLSFGILVGFGVSPFFVASVSTITRWFKKKRGLALGIVLSGNGVGSLLFPIFAGLIISIYGWRMTFAIFGIILWILTIPAGLMMKHDPREIRLEAYYKGNETSPNYDQTTGCTVVEAFKTTQFWIVYSILFCACVILFFILVHFASYLTDIGFSRITAATALGLMGGSNIIGRVAMGSVSDKIGRKHAFIICFAIQAIIISYLTVIRNIWMIYTFAVFFGFSYGGWVPQIPAITEELFGTRYLSTILGLGGTAYGIAGVVGPIIGGYIFDMSGSYYLAFLFSVVLCALSIVLAFLLKPLHLKKELRFLD